MTHSEVPRTRVNPTYQLDVDDVGCVPHCTESQKQRTSVYERPNEVEPVYESPLTLLHESKTDRRHESTGSNGRRSKRNDIYETTNDDALANGRCSGYSYVVNTENVLPRLSDSSFARDNLVSATDGENNGNHVYEESCRNSRFSENAVYNDSASYTLQGIRRIYSDASSKDSRARTSDGKQRTSCVQIFALLLSILACLIGIFALVVASGKVKLDNDGQKEHSTTVQELKTQERTGENNQPPWKYNITDVNARNEELKQEVASLKKDVTDIIARNEQLKQEVASSKEDYSVLKARYKELRKELTFTKQNYTEHMAKYQNTTNQFNDLYQKLGKKIDNIDLTLTAKLNNVSKQTGPRGFNGTQGIAGPRGPQGKQGIGNFSLCKFDQNVATTILSNNRNSDSVSVSPKEHTPGWKVIWATCSTEEGKGAIQTVLSRENGGFKCTCAGPSEYSIFRVDSEDKMKCIIMYWTCPENS